MPALIRGLAPATLLSCLCLAVPARADWTVAPELEAVRTAPGNFQLQPQNPPSFAWSRHRDNPPAYVVEVYKAGVLNYRFTSERNWYLPSKSFPAGDYTWRVRPSTTQEWSDSRAFSITADAAPFVVPDDATLRAAAAARARPRELPPGFLASARWSPAMQAERGKALNTLINEVNWKIGTMKALADSDWPLVTGTIVNAATNAQNADIRTRVNTAARQLEAASLLYRLTLDRKYLSEALARGDQLAALNPEGPTSYAHQDQGTRQIALALSKGLDLLDTSVDATRRAAWQKSVTARTNDIYADLAGSNGRLDQYPYDSHGGTNLGFLAVIAALNVGSTSDATRWFDFAVRAYMNSVYAWSGPEGGFANGTAYGQYTADYALQIWQPLLQTTGVNLFAKPWSGGFLRFFAHFVPPGSVRHSFGDESELAPDYRPLKALAARIAAPEAAWYSHHLSGDEDALTLLQAPYPLPAQQVAEAAPPNTALYPSIGWVAMHSALADPARTALFFKSSPYGAYNHSHGDQNGFTLTAGSHPLLIETGYLDYYGSPLFNDWYRQTKAGNGVTYDGGIGQLVAGNTANLGRNGRITAFQSTPALDYTEGDASAAYGSVLSTALRRLWYLRSENAWVVQDKLRAPAPHVWEWNFHSPTAQVVNNNVATISNGGATVCVRPLVNDAAYPVRYATRSGPPPMPGTTEFHGAYVTPAATHGDFLMLIDPGCRHPSVKVSDASTTRTIVIGSQTISVPRE